MNKNPLFLILFSAIMFYAVIHGCTKSNGEVDPNQVISSAYTQEFEYFQTMLYSGGWKEIEPGGDSIGSTNAIWEQGYNGMVKGDSIDYFGFSAYSYHTYQTEYAYSFILASVDTLSVNSWLLSPTFKVKNGDKISFYTRGDTTGIFTDRMQVLINKSNSTNVGNSLNSVGDFTTTLFDINPNQSEGGFPTKWTKYEYTFSGISGSIETRIAFRHYVIKPKNARGIGIDQFKFQPY
jgi:hypothetical protein